MNVAEKEELATVRERWESETIPIVLAMGHCAADLRFLLRLVRALEEQIDAEHQYVETAIANLGELVERICADCTRHGEAKRRAEKTISDLREMLARRGR